MEEMTLRVPVAIKSKVTDTLKNKIIADLQQQMDMVDQDLQQIEFQAKRLLSEQAKIDAQGLIQLRQQIEEEKQQRVAFKAQVAERLKEAEKLGFKRAIVPKANLPKNAPKDFPNLQIYGVDNLQDAVSLCRDLADE